MDSKQKVPWGTRESTPVERTRTWLTPSSVKQESPGFSRGKRQREFRTEGVSWWPEEIPSDEERETCETSLEQCGWHVDHVLTHDAPSDMVPKLGMLSGRRFRADEYERWLNSIAYRTGFGHWWMGHYHIDADLGAGFTVLYRDVVRVA